MTGMKDIAERLRDSADTWQFEAENAGQTGGVEDLLGEAADEIEMLRAELTELVVRHGLDWPAILNDRAKLGSDFLAWWNGLTMANQESWLQRNPIDPNWPIAIANLKRG